MAKDISLQLTLNIKPFKSDVKNAKKAIQQFLTQFQESGIEINADSDIDEVAAESEGDLEAIPDEEVEISADGEQAKTEADDVEREIDEIPDEKVTDVNVVGNSLQTLGNISLAFQGVTQAVQQAKAVIGEYLNLSNVQEDAETKLAAALKNTGQYTDEAFKSLKNYASQIQSVTRYGDEAILTSTALAQNIGEFGSDVLPDVIDAAIGLATAYDMDLKTAMMLIGRARKGQTQTLTRYGIVLDTTASKEEQFAQLLDQGRQKMELATAEAESGAGFLEQYSNLVGDLQENIGDALKKAIMPFVKALRDIVTWMIEHEEVVNALLVALGSFAAIMLVLKARQIAYNTTLAITNALAGNWIALVGAAVVGVAAYKAQTSALSEKEGELAEEQKRVNTEATNQIAQFKTLTDRYLQLKEQTDLTETETKLYHDTIKQLNEKYPEYLGNIDLEKAGYEDVEQALINVRNQLRQKAQDQAILANTKELQDELVKSNQEEYHLIQDKLDLQSDLETMQKDTLEFQELMNISSKYNLDTDKEIVDTQDLISAIQDRMDDKQVEINDKKAEQSEIEGEIQKYYENYPDVLSNVSDAIDGVTQKLDDVGKYYQQVKFADSDYYEWKKQQILNEIAEMEISNEQKKVLTQKLLSDLTNKWREFFNFTDQDLKVNIKAGIDIEKPKQAIKQGLDKFRAEVPDNDAFKIDFGIGTEFAGFAKDAQKTLGVVDNVTGEIGGLYENMYQLKKQKLDNAMNDEIKAVEQSKLSEQEKQAKIQNIREKYKQKELAAKKKMKGVKVAEAVSNTALAVTKTLTGYVFPLNLIVAAIVAAQGAMQVAAIKAQEYARGGLVKFQKFAEGGIAGMQMFPDGEISGPGTTKSDSIPALLSDQEYVINAEATKKYYPVLEAINSNKFASGGPVGDIDHDLSSGSSLKALNQINKSVKILNQNLVDKEMNVEVINKAPNLETQVKNHELTKKKMERAGEDFSERSSEN